MKKKTIKTSSIKYPIIEEKLKMKSDPEFSISYNTKKETKKKSRGKPKS